MAAPTKCRGYRLPIVTDDLKGQTVGLGRDRWSSRLFDPKYPILSYMTGFAKPPETQSKSVELRLLLRAVFGVESYDRVVTCRLDSKIDAGAGVG